MKPRFSQAALSGAPAPAARYLRLVLREDQPLPSSAVVRQRGEFRTPSGWRPFSATQRFWTEPPGFVRDARIRMAPLVSVRVRDAYENGRGSMHARLAGIVPLVSEENKKELSLGALQRYLAEAAWFPTALLPGRGVGWTSVDDLNATAKLSDSGNEVFLSFRFDEAGRIVEVFTEERYREVEGTYVPTPWRGTFRTYEERSGLLVPIEAEVEWILPDGPYPYWRGRRVRRVRAMRISRTFPLLLAFTLEAAASTKVIIDADPGIDDAMAIAFALRSPELEVLGITTVFGNAEIDVATANALRLVELLDRDVPVARGASRPLVVPLRPPPDFVHGRDGLGNIDAPPPKRRPVESSAAELIIATARRYPGDVTLLAVGRLTNLAIALSLEPRLPELVKEVVLMGGAVSVPGNVSPVAEANISGDPHAADVVFQAPWRVTMVGLDVTTRVRLTDDVLERMARTDERVGGFLYRISRFYRSFYESIGVTGGFYVHDPSAVAFVIDRSLFETERARVRVATESVAVGQTIAAWTAWGPRVEEWPAWKGLPEVEVCRNVDSGKLLTLFETTAARSTSSARDP